MSRTSRKIRRKHQRRCSIFVLSITGFLIFCCGFLVGKASANPSTQIEDAYPRKSVLQQKFFDEVAVGDPDEANSSTDPEDRESTVEWNLILVNAAHPLPKDFRVSDLTQLRNGHAIDSRAYPALQKMMDAARVAGLQPLICSSFRTWDKQNELFTNKVSYYRNQGYSQLEAEENAARWVARPGTSEHQAGLAVDIVDINYQLLDEQQEQTPVQLWLMEHCAEYGFILRYPEDKSDLTGVEYEPWHYRYVGEDAAKEIMERGLCLEEYIQEHDK